MVNITADKTKRNEKSRNTRRTWSHFVRVMAMVVVFCTTYALILPAITIESGTICGVGEHTHTDACYQAVETVPCEIPESEGHAHAETCYTIEENALTCALEEAAAHAHSEECSGQVLICALEEAQAHAHSEACNGQNLVCALAEAAAHTHSDTCTGEVSTLVCAEAESETHAHAAACYQVETKACAMEETGGHAHGDACYEAAVVCGLAETEGHAHGDACYEAGVVCAVEQTEGHAHGEVCYGTVQTLACGLEESEGHSHANDEQPMELVCSLNEHVHIAECYPVTEETTSEATEETEAPVSDPTADVETAADWEAGMAAVELTGDWSEDLLAIARSQMGYTESARNFTVDEAGKVSGYTRYGAWYGLPYGDWCAMFVSFCLEYAEVDDIGRGSSCTRWIGDLTANKQYRAAGVYTPVPGDIIFFNWNEDEYSEHVGIVEQIIPATGEEPAKVRVIEGNSSNRVRYVDYAVDDESIMGYGVLPTEPGPTYEYADDSVQVSVVLPKDTAVPETAVLKVTPIESDADGYDSLVEKANNAVEGTVTKIKLYDISFYTENDEYIPVDDEAKVSIRFVENVVNANANVEVLHFAEEDAAPVVLAGVTVDEETPVAVEEPQTLEELSAPIVNETAELAAPETVVEFKTNGFSTFAVIEVENLVVAYPDEFVTNLDGKTLAIISVRDNGANNGEGDPLHAVTSANADDSENRRMGVAVDWVSRSNGTVNIPYHFEDSALWTFEEVNAAQGEYNIKSSNGQYLNIGDESGVLGEAQSITVIARIVNGQKIVILRATGTDYYLNRYKAGTDYCGYENPASNDVGNQFILVQDQNNTIYNVISEANATTQEVDGENRVTDLDKKSLGIISIRANPIKAVTDVPSIRAATMLHGTDVAWAVEGTSVTIGDTFVCNGVTYDKTFWYFEAVADKVGVYTVQNEDGKYLNIGANTAAVTDNPQEITVVVRAAGDGNAICLYTVGDNATYWLCRHGGDDRESHAGYTDVDAGMRFVLADATNATYKTIVLQEEAIETTVVNLTQETANTGLDGRIFAISTAKQYGGAYQALTAENVTLTETYNGDHAHDRLIASAIAKDGTKVTTYAGKSALWMFTAVAGKPGVYTIKSVKNPAQYLNLNLSDAGREAKTSETPQEITVAVNDAGNVALRVTIQGGAHYLNYDRSDPHTPDVQNFRTWGGAFDEEGNVLVLSEYPLEEPVVDLDGQTLAIVSTRADQAVAYNAATTKDNTAALGGANVTWVEENNIVTVPDDAEAVTSWTFEAVNAAAGVYYVKTNDGKYLNIGYRTAEITDTPQEITVTSRSFDGTEYVGLSVDGNYLNDYGDNDSTYAGWNGNLGNDTGARFVLAEKVTAAFTATVLSREDLRNAAMMPNAQLIFFVKQVVDGVDHYYAVNADGSAVEIRMLSDNLAEGAIMYSTTDNANLRWDATGSATGGGWGTAAQDQNTQINLQYKNIGTGEYLLPNVVGGTNNITSPANVVDGDDRPLYWGVRPSPVIAVTPPAGVAIDTNIAHMFLANPSQNLGEGVDGSKRLTYDAESEAFSVEEVGNVDGPKDADNTQQNVFYIARVDTADLIAETVSTDKNLVGQILTREEFQDAANEYGNNWPFFVIACGTDNSYYAIDAYGQAQPVEFIKDNTLEAGGRFIFETAKANTTSYGDRAYNPNMVLWNPYSSKFNNFATNNYADGWVELWMSNVATHAYLSPNASGLTASFPSEGEFSPGFFYSNDKNDGISSYLAARLGQVNAEGVTPDGDEQRYIVKLNTEDKRFEVLNYWGTEAGDVSLNNDLNGNEDVEYVFYVAMLVDRNVDYNAADKSVEQYEPFTGVSENVRMYVFNYGAAIDYYGQVDNNTVSNETKIDVPDRLNYGDDLMYRFFYRPSFSGEAIDGTNDPNNANNNLYSNTDIFDAGSSRVFENKLINGYPAIRVPRELTCTEDHTHDDACYDAVATFGADATQQYFSLRYLFDPEEFITNPNSESTVNAGFSSLTIADSSNNGSMHAIDGNNGTDVNSVGGVALTQVTCVDTDAWNGDGATVTVDLDLTAGNNLIRIGGWDGGDAPNVKLDGISFNGDPIDDDEVGIIGGVTRNDTHFNGIKGTESTLQLSVDAPQDGTYPLTIRYAQDATRSFGISVDGKTPPAEKDDTVANNPNYAVRSYKVGNGATTGLFQKDDDGYFFYDSKVNAATYDEDSGLFQLYNFAMIPGGYMNLDGGNFLPFNDATTQGRLITSDQFTTNGDGVWSDNRDVPGEGGDPILPDTTTKATRYYKLNGFQQDNDTTIGRESMADLWMGMTMEIDFTMTEDGKIRVVRPIQVRDTAGAEPVTKQCVRYDMGNAVYWWDDDAKVMYDANGLKTEYTDQTQGMKEHRNDLVFSFAGDDDVLVYVDDYLIMDMNGIHGVWEGEINFRTGLVDNEQYAGAYTDGKTIRELINAVDPFTATTEVPNDPRFGTAANGLANTFAPGSDHTLKFFYLERGGNISDCAISFNMEPLPTGALSVTKQVEGLDEDDAVTDVDGEQYIYKGEYTFQLVDIIQPFDNALFTEDQSTEGVIWKIPYTISSGANIESTGILNLTPVTKEMPLPLESGGSETHVYEICRYYTNGLPTDPSVDEDPDHPYVLIYRWVDTDDKIYFFSDYDNDGLYDKTLQGEEGEEGTPDNFYKLFQSDTFTLENGQTANFDEFILGTLVKVKEFPVANGVQLGTTYWWQVKEGDQNAMNGLHEADPGEGGSKISHFFKIVDKTNVNIVCKNVLDPVNLSIRKVLYNKDGETVSTDTTTEFKIKYTVTYPVSDFYRVEGDGLYEYNLLDDASGKLQKGDLLRQTSTNTWTLQNQGTYGKIVDTNDTLNEDTVAVSVESTDPEANAVTYVVEGFVGETAGGKQELLIDNLNEFMWTVNIPFGSKVVIDELEINGYKVDWTYSGKDYQHGDGAMLNPADSMYYFCQCGACEGHEPIDKYTPGTYLNPKDGKYYELTKPVQAGKQYVVNVSDSGVMCDDGSSATDPAEIKLLTRDNYVTISNTPVDTTVDMEKKVVGGSETAKFAFKYTVTPPEGEVMEGTLFLADADEKPGKITDIPRGSTVTITESGIAKIGEDGELVYDDDGNIVIDEKADDTYITSYEVHTTISAEEFHLTGSQVKLNNSGDVGYIKGDTDTVEFVVYAPEAGAYPIELAYAQNDERSFGITVNQPWLQVPCAATGAWTGTDDKPWGTATINLALTAGDNVITIGGTTTTNAETGEVTQNDAPNVQLGGISVKGATSLSQITTTGTAAIVDTENRYGGIKGDTGTLQFTVNVEKDGIYPLTISYATYTSRSFGIQVNGGAKKAVACANNGSWTSASGSVTTAVSLNAGKNVITIGGVDGADAPNLDSVDITLFSSVSGKVFTGVVYNPIYVTCTNTQTYELPESGGEGTFMYIFGGLFMMAVPLVYYGISKRSRRERRAGV